MVLRAMALAGVALAGTPSDPPGSPTVRHSIGTPRSGRLAGAVRLRPGPGYFVRDAATSWGTPTMVAHLHDVLRSLHEAHPRTMLRVGDLSLRGGGKLSAHRAHQSGRDVDLGLVPPPGIRPRGSFERGSAERAVPVDPRATLHLLRELAATSDRPGGAQWVLLDYAVQATLHAEGRAQGLDPAELDALLQYPHGRDAARGFVRHMPGHRNHIHVRFACAPGDEECRGPAEPPAPRVRPAR